jgi:hypothetical protein
VATLSPAPTSLIPEAQFQPSTGAIIQELDSSEVSPELDPAAGRIAEFVGFTHTE